MKIVINKCYGGFGLSLKAKRRLAELRGQKLYFYKQTKYRYRDGIDEYSVVGDCERDFFGIYALTKNLGKTINELPDDDDLWLDDCRSQRDDPKLIQVVEELGDEASGECSHLKIVEIPDDVEWEIKEYDGAEWIAEKHRTWS